MTGSIWCAGLPPFGLPWDQRPDEAFSLVYDWPVEAEIEIMGHPRVELAVSSSVPVAFVSAKLCDVAPGRDVGARHPRDPEPHPPRFARATLAIPAGEPIGATIELDATAYVFEPGHPDRLDLAPSDFPSPWPPPLAEHDRVDPRPPPSSSRGWTARPSRHRRRSNPEPRRQRRRPGPVGDTRGGPAARSAPSRSTTAASAVGSTPRPRTGTTARSGCVGRPGHCTATAGAELELGWAEATVRAESRTVLRSDPETWHLAIDLEVYDGDELIAERRWERRAARPPVKLPAVGRRRPARATRPAARAPSPASSPPRAGEPRSRSRERVRDRLVEGTGPQAGRRRLRGVVRVEPGRCGCHIGNHRSCSSPSARVHSSSAHTNVVSAPPAARSRRESRPSSPARRDRRRRTCPCPRPRSGRARTRRGRARRCPGSARPAARRRASRPRPPAHPVGEAVGRVVRPDDVAGTDHEQPAVEATRGLLLARHLQRSVRLLRHLLRVRVRGVGRAVASFAPTGRSSGCTDSEDTSA